MRWRTCNKSLIHARNQTLLMGYIAIKLDSGKLANPDLDLRYKIPAAVAEATGGQVSDGGYDYGDGDDLLVYLVCNDLDSGLVDVKTLREQVICDNQLLDSAVIGTSLDGSKFSIVYPDKSGGEFTVRPW